LFSFNLCCSTTVVNLELISAVSYFSNDFDTATPSVDVVANYTMALMGGDTLLSLAYNWNETTVNQFNPETTNEGKAHRLEEAIPDHRVTFTVSKSWENVSTFVRVNYFGEYFATHADDACAVGCWNKIADSAVTVNAEVSYFLNDSITLSVGANNIFDQEAQKLPAKLYDQLGAKYYKSGPFDYNGGFYYVKATYNF
jgi:iron complex outermembrane receptor protein